MKKEVFNKKVIPAFFLSLLVASVGIFIGFFIAPILFLPIVIAEFIILVATFFLRRTGKVHLWLVMLFVVLTGITTAPIVAWAEIEGGGLIILEALVLTTVVFGAISGYVYFTNKDFRSWGTILTFGLLGLIIASLFNVFIKSDIFGIFIDGVVLLIFLGFVAYDMSKILRDYDDRDVGPAVLSLYLDFLNIFIRILQFLMMSRRRE